MIWLFPGTVDFCFICLCAFFVHVSVPMLVFDSESLAVAHVILEIVCNGGWPFYSMDVCDSGRVWM